MMLPNLHKLIPIVNSALGWVFAVLVVIYIMSGLDDLFVDLYAWIRGLRPKFLGQDDLDAMAALPQKRIAIIVPAWDEGVIIKRMIAGNIGRIDYSDYHFFVGCYPNDPATVNAVRDLQEAYPNVHAVVNFKDGPTSKGQILNWVIDSILDWELSCGVKFDAFLMQDSEDLIHAKTLQLVNRELSSVDFVQIPVFSLPLRSTEIVAGVYVDEFAESHTKDILVRDALGGGVPSAGVGTAMTRKFVMAQRGAHEGQLLRDGCLTEDYELGVLAGIDSWPQRFAACWYRHPVTGYREYIATREYFPKAFRRSVRQKTRWTLGIAIQGWRQIGWQGTLTQRYFLFRDRKGLLTNPAMLVGYLWAILFGAVVATPEVSVSDIFQSEALAWTGFLTAAFAVNRLLQRFICVARVYGSTSGLMIPVRWPVGNIINSFAVLNAFYRDAHSLVTKKSVAWAKTEHELPEDFGGETISVQTAANQAVRG